MHYEMFKTRQLSRPFHPKAGDKEKQARDIKKERQRGTVENNILRKPHG